MREGEGTDEAWALAQTLNPANRQGWTSLAP